MSDLMTVDEIANVLRLHPTTIRRWVKQGILDAITLPHVNDRQSYRIRRETLDRVLNTTTNA